MKKKIISICLALVIIFSCSVFASADNYEDIAGHWAEKAIYTWSDRGVINGVGNNSFAPDADMTRAEAATVFTKMFKLEEKADISTFSDVSSDAWYREAFEKCVEAGIIGGEGDKINPNGRITREMFFTMLVRALNIETENSLKKHINDANAISDWAKESIYTLVNNGYVNGLGDNTIAPKNNINRASVITLIDRLIVNYAAEDNALLRSHDKGISLVLADNVKVEKGFSGTILIKKDDTQLLLTGASTDVKVIVVADGVTVKNATKGTEVTVSGESNNVTVNGERIKSGSTFEVKTQVIVSSGTSSGGAGSVHSHSYSEEVTTKATCLTDGVKTFTCRCGDSYTEVIPKLSEKDEHTAGMPVKENIVPESCTSEGTYDEVVYCSVCEVELSRTAKTTEKLVHIPATAVKENEVAGTCETKSTYDEVVYCSACGDELSRTSKTGEYGAHLPATAVKENEVTGSCEVKSTYDEVVYCSVCGVELSRTSKTGEYGAHSPATAVKENEVAGTCKVKATYDEVVYCLVCEEEISRTSKTGEYGEHESGTAVKENEVAGTCKVKATYDEVVYCSVCGEEISRTGKTGEYGDHEPGTAVKENEVAGTCKVKATYDEVVYCLVCGDEMTRTSKTGEYGTHLPATAVKENEVSGTCEVKGTYDEVVYCSVCGDELSRTGKTGEYGTHLPASAVKENEVSGTCEVKSTYDEVVCCSVCGEELSRTSKTGEYGAHLPATAVKENEVAGTCEVKATYDEVVYCSVCGDEMTRTTKTGEYGDHKYTDGSCEYCGEDEPITEPAIRVSKVVANAGGTVDVTISVVNNPGISSAIFSLTYDNNVMTLTNAELQQSFGGIIAPLPNEVKSPVSFVWYDQNMRDNANNGTMLKLTFEISGDVETGEIYDIVVNYVPGNIINIDEQNVEFETFNGKITIE